MKQDKTPPPPPPPASGEHKVSTPPPPPSRRLIRPSPKPKDSPTSTSHPHLNTHTNTNHKLRASLPFNTTKPKSTEPGVEVAVSPGAAPRSRPSRSWSSPNTDKEKKELRERLNSSEILVNNLQSQVMELKAQVHSLHTLNLELVSQNNCLADHLTLAQSKISTLSTHNQAEKPQARTSNFKDVHKLIANQLENLQVKNNAVKERTSVQISSGSMSKPVTRAAIVQPIAESSSPPISAMPPPPPPPPLPRVPSRASTTKKAPTIVEFYNTLTKNEGRKDPLQSGIRSNRVVNNAHSSIVGEIQNRSTHLLAIKSDVETKGEFIKSLIEKIQTAAYADIEDVLKFVDWLDSELSTLADERAVLKHFNWPERKADAMREAAIEYRDLKLLEREVSSYKVDSSMPCEVALRKITNLLDKSERSIQRLIKLRDTRMLSFRECKIPIEWMLDSGMVHKIKQASMKLAKMYMQRISMELLSVRNLERESTQEALLIQGVRFAYRAHQFAGGLDSETMSAFEEIRQRVPVNVGGSRELLAGIVS